MKSSQIILFIVVIIGMPLIAGFNPHGFSGSSYEIFIYLSLGILFFLFAIWLLRESIPARNPTHTILIRIFYSYFYLIIFMGSIYFMISKNDHEAFVFVNDMRNKENKIELINQKYDSILMYNERIYLINKALEKSDTMYSIFKNSQIKNVEANNQDFESIDSTLKFSEVSDLKFKLYRFCPYDTISRLESFAILHLSSNGFNQIMIMQSKESKNDFISDLLTVLDLTDFENHLIKTKNVYHAIISKLNDRQASRLKSNYNGNILDYMYLSAMTTTTLGFGDIIPNSGFSRMAITLHALLSVLFLAFAAIIISDNGQNKIPNEKESKKE